MSKSSFPSLKLSVPSDQRITRLFDCLRCIPCLGHGRRGYTDAYILAHFILRPPPAYRVFDLELNRHTLFTDVSGLGCVVVVVFWAHVSVRMEWFGVHFDKIRHTDYPVLVVHVLSRVEPILIMSIAYGAI
jgi:hypothetical protein